MSNFLIKQGAAYSVKVPIPTDVQEVFGKRSFKKSLQTSDKALAIARSGPLIVEFKAAIEDARGNPHQQLADYLRKTKEVLLNARQRRIDPDAVAAIEDDIG